ncbi:MAG: hypothetical protein HOF47_09180 [Actinobacteria bacterium]|nr:hypothetical protein [Actinomycetota bacterium]
MWEYRSFCRPYDHCRSSHYDRRPYDHCRSSHYDRRPYDHYRYSQCSNSGF